MTDTITVKDIVFEAFQDYKKPSMLIAMCNCDWKCAKEGGFDKSVCQNSVIAKQKNIVISIDELCKKYISNPITQAIVFGGLEPMLQILEVNSFIYALRNKHHCIDDVVIYTGYYKEEIPNEIILLSQHENIIIKFGRYDQSASQMRKQDKILGIELASNNQYAERIS